ncbi:alkaline shock response membrane anchor protein AmaP [Eubacteriales bacterium OttesenSCG-928-N14]|nr:alkaline shock response membrane anchor protein AmaP [Eubacteriales bacterium OttesenSCG-928-N14]
MKLFDRFLLTLLTIAVIALCVCVTLLAWGVIPVSTVTEGVFWMNRYTYIKVAVTAGALLITIVCLKLMFSRAANTENRPQQAPSTTTAQGNQKAIQPNVPDFVLPGGVRIAANVIVESINRSAKQVEGISNANSVIGHLPEGGLGADVALSVLPGTNIPEASQKVKDDVLQMLKTSMGIETAQIDVRIDSHES